MKRQPPQGADKKMRASAAETTSSCALLLWSWILSVLVLGEPLVAFQEVLDARSATRSTWLEAEVSWTWRAAAAGFRPPEFDIAFDAPWCWLHLFFRRDVRLLAAPATLGFLLVV